MGKFYCSLCETSHHELILRVQCSSCGRFFCDTSFNELQSVGRENCPYCDNPIRNFIRINLEKTDSQRVMQDESGISHQLKPPYEVFIEEQASRDESLQKHEALVAIEEQVSKQLNRESKDSIFFNLDYPDNFSKKYDIKHITEILYLWKWDRRHYPDVPYIPPKKVLKKIPEKVGELFYLERLDLDHGWSKPEGIKILPESLRNLKMLRFLNLRFNKLKVLPDWIGELKNLRTIDLGANEIVYLPSSIGLLENLTELKLYLNKIQEIPDSIANLSRLTVLNISSNRLTSIPDAIKSLTLLENFDIYGNKIKMLPTSLCHLENLAVLRIHQNKIEFIPDCLEILPLIYFVYDTDYFSLASTNI